MEVFFGVDAYGVEVSGFDVDVDAVFEEAELFEALGLFEGARGQGGEALECCFAVGVEADVLPVLRRCGAVAGLPITIKGDGGSREVECATVGCGGYFDCVWVGDVLGCAENLEGGDFDVGLVDGRRRAVRCSGLRRGSSPWMLT